jgi:DNA-binding phage protein
MEKEGQMSKRDQSHDDAMVDLLRKDPGFAAEYIRVSFEELGKKGGPAAPLGALRDVARARGMAEVVRATGIERERRCYGRCYDQVLERLRLVDRVAPGRN